MQGGTDDSQVHCPHPAHHEKELTANPYQPKDQKAIYRPERGLQAVRSGGLMYLYPKPIKPLEGRYRVATVFYMPTRRRTDLTNLIEAAHDVLVAGKILADDNYTIIASVDGSRVMVDKENPRTEIFIEELEV
jgi:Holliday junction resolvase RusA-like endonuclease